MTLVKQTDLAVWRYGIISHLLHRGDAEESLEHELIRLAAKTFVATDGRTVRYSPETCANGSIATATAGSRH